MRVSKKSLPWLLVVVALLLAFGCSDGGLVIAPDDGAIAADDRVRSELAAAQRAGLSPAAAVALHGFGVTASDAPVPSMSLLLSDAPVQEISVRRAPGPDGLLDTADDIFPWLWPTKFMGMGSPPGDLWNALGVDLALIDEGVAFTATETCLGSQRASPNNNWAGGTRISFLDPETAEPTTASFISVEANGSQVGLRAYDAAGELLGTDLLATFNGFLTVESPGIAWADVTGSFWCAAHRIRYVIEAPIQQVVDETPPELDVAVTPDILWPVNHAYRVIAISVDATDDTADPQDLVVLAEVVSSDPDNATGSGDGDTTGDIRVTRPDGTVLLSSNESPIVSFDPRVDQLEVRAERAATGGGRAYTIQVTATDPSGNAAVAIAKVAVPRNLVRVQP